MVDAKIPAGVAAKARVLWSLLAETYREWSNDNATALGAALAFYTTFSLSPLLIVITAVAGSLVGRAEIKAEIMERVRESVGPAGAEVVNSMISKAFQPGAGMAASVVGVIVLLYGATQGFVMLRRALNIMWEAKPATSGSLKRYLGVYLLSFAMVLTVGLLLVLSLILSAGLAGVDQFIGHVLPLPVFFFQVANFIFSVGLITLLIALIFKVLPDVEIAWSDVWIGAAITALLFTLGNVFLGWYLGRSSITSAYGAASSLVILLLWIYYSAQVLLVGAEFTQVYANKYGSKVRPRGPHRTPASSQEKSG